MIFKCQRLSFCHAFNFRISHSAFATKSSMSDLAKLRKVTGHTFGFCREALAACSNDYDRAFTWIQEESAKRGMAKAEKLKNRPMSQGLLGLLSTPRCVAAVEVNCETDFVARNHEFQSLVASTTESLFKYLSGTPEVGTHRLSEENLKSLSYALSPPKSVSEALAEAIASIGENMAIPRGVGMNLSPDKANNHSHLMAYCHISTTGIQKRAGDVQFGKYVAIVRYRQLKNQKDNPSWHNRASRVCQQLCQHIVGMNPRLDLSLESTAAENPDDEKCLFRQPFLLDESITVGKLLQENEIFIEDFVRVECGVEDD